MGDWENTGCRPTDSRVKSSCIDLFRSAQATGRLDNRNADDILNRSAWWILYLDNTSQQMTSASLHCYGTLLRFVGWHWPAALFEEVWLKSTHECPGTPSTDITRLSEDRLHKVDRLAFARFKQVCSSICEEHLL